MPVYHVREELAELCHSQWSGWMKYLFSKCSEIEIMHHFLDDENKLRTREESYMIIPEWGQKRWKRQTELSYKELSEEEKNSDRFEADKFLQCIRQILNDRLATIENKREKDKTFFKEFKNVVIELENLIKIFGGI